MTDKTDEFYIGWQEHAPIGIARHIRASLLVLSVLVGLICGLLVLHQKGFTNATFELGQYTELEGVISLKPVPFLKINHGNDVHGQAVNQIILLVGFGKRGAEKKLAAFASEVGQALDGHLVKLEGSLIYYDGKTLFEPNRMNSISPVAIDTANQEWKFLGSGTLMGEITDPKCLFGVMKPGSGKPHRSCAARCIAGGIPPVLKTSSANGQIQYYILLGEDGEMINQRIQPFAGDLVFICGQIRQFGDWLFLFKDNQKDLALIPNKWKDSIPLPICGN